MRLGLIAVLGGLYLLWSGGQGLYTALKNREPFQVACQNYGDVKPSREWVALTGCSLSLMEASYIESGGTVEELFIPARGEGQEEGAPIHVLVATKDPDLLAAANQLIKIEDETELMKFAVEHHEQMFRTKDVTGLVRYGVDLDDSDRAKLKSLDATLAENFVILDDGRSPGYGRSLGFMTGGALLVIVTGVGVLGSGGSKS
jgi:hypothetical protein